MIREAKHVDIFRLAELGHDMHRRSRYWGRAVLKPDRLKKLLVALIQDHGVRSCVFVGERDGRIDSFIAGISGPIYDIGDKAVATDRFFYAEHGADPRHAGGLLDAFLAWARGRPDIIEIQTSSNSVIVDSDPARVEKLFISRGLKPEGRGFFMELPT